MKDGEREREREKKKKKKGWIPHRLAYKSLATRQMLAHGL
jgi:hypothetical protein